MCAKARLIPRKVRKIMAEKVYFAKLTVKNPADNKLAKIRRLCKVAGLEDKVKPFEVSAEDQLCAIKIPTKHKTCVRRQGLFQEK